MTLSITAVQMTSDVTPHTAKGFPDGWRVTWLGDRTVDYNLAITAMMIAEEAMAASRGDLLSEATLKSCRLIDDLAGELDLTGEQAIDMVRETLPPAVVHLVFIPVDGPIGPRCGGTGRSVSRRADATCPACLAEVHDTHAIPAGDEPELAGWEHEILASSQPIKTHDLSVEKRHGNVAIKVENELEDHMVYLQEGAALDLGIVLAVLTPAQIALLVDELTAEQVGRVTS